MKHLSPMNDRILVRRDESETTSPGGLFLPNKAPENRGTVVAVGPGRRDNNGTRHAIELSPGDRILFGPYSGANELDVDGEKLLVMSESDVIAKYV